MLPLSLLKTSQGHPMLVELKNGETYNGHVVNCDTSMNIHLREVICTSKDGDRFWRMPECYIHGNTIKYLRLPDELVELKNGETYNGHVVNCDTWMNIHLREVICTSKDGDRFWRMPECYIRGNTIKYLRVPDEVIDKVQEESKNRTEAISDANKAIELDASIPKAYLRQGTAYFNLEEYYNAKTAFEAGAALVPEDARFTERIKKRDKCIAEEEGELVTPPMRAIPKATLTEIVDEAPKESDQVNTISSEAAITTPAKPKYRDIGGGRGQAKGGMRGRGGMDEGGSGRGRSQGGGYGGNPSGNRVMEGVDRLNELPDDILVNNIMSRLNCTTKDLIRTTATISKRWRNLWTQLPRLIFTYNDGRTYFDKVEMGHDPDIRDYISSIDNTLNQCPENINLKKFTLFLNCNSLVNSEFKSQAKRWIRYAIGRNVEDVVLWLNDVGIYQDFTYDDELFFNNLCFNHLKVTHGLFNPPNGAISWERLESLRLVDVKLFDDTIEKILSGSPCLESLELTDCLGPKHIVVSSKSVKKLVLTGYDYLDSEDDDMRYISMNAPYISSLVVKGFFSVELLFLDVSSLTKAELDYSVDMEIFENKTHEDLLRERLKSLDKCKDVIINDFWWEFYSNLKARGVTSKVVTRCGSPSLEDWEE